MHLVSGNRLLCPPPPTLSLVNPNWLDGVFSLLFISSPGSLDNQCVSLGKSLTLPCLILPLWKEGGPSGPTYSKELSRGALWQWGPQRTTFGFRCAFSLPEDRSPPWFQGFSMLPCSTPADPLGQDGWVQPQVLSGETEVQTVFYGGVL